MSLGRRKKNSTLLAGSMTVRSLGSVRRRYPASDRISAADSESVPLLGTATRQAWRSQTCVHVVEGQPAGDHQHLRPVQQLADLVGQLRRLLRVRRPATPRRPLRGSSCLVRARRRPGPRRCRYLPAGCALLSLSSANRASKVFTGRDCFTTARAKSRRFRRRSRAQAEDLGDAWCRISPCMSSSDTPLVSITHRHTKSPDNTAHRP